MVGDRSVADILEVNYKLLKALILYYTKIEGIINWETWEKIIARACGGTWIPGDKYMADAIKNNYGLNIKSVLKNYNKRQIDQYIDYVQCRVPIQNESLLNDNQIGEEIIKTLILKKQESFDDLNIDQMVDVIIVHNRNDDFYNVRIFFENHPDYRSYDFTWIDQCGYIPDQEKWKLKRNPSDKYGQTRLAVKSKFSLINCDLDFSLFCPIMPEPTNEELLFNYDNYVNQIKTNS